MSFNPCENCIHYPQDYPFCPRSETYVNRRFATCCDYKKKNWDKNFDHQQKEMISNFRREEKIDGE